MPQRLWPALSISTALQRIFAPAGCKKALRWVLPASACMRARPLSAISAPAGFFKYAAYGDTINIASRLEGANKRFGTRICVSAAIVERIPGFKGRPVGDLVLRGRAGALRSFEALTGQAHAHAATPAYCKAFAQLERGDAGAMAAFAALVGLRTEDHLVNFHLRRLLAGEKGTRIDMQQGETWTNAGVLTPG